MVHPKITEFGGWVSPFSADLVTANNLRINSPRVYRGSVYWVEQRPSEGGRAVLMRQTDTQTPVDVTPKGVSVGSRVHEYGGGEYCFVDDTAIYCQLSDQLLYQISLAQPSAEPRVITADNGLRYADMVYDAPRNRLIAVVEDHRQAGPPVNSLASVDLTSGATAVLVSGDDFYASPTVSPCGQFLAYFSWNQPNMPWDATTLWRKDLSNDAPAAAVAGNSNESVCHPQWSPDGRLFFVSDRSGWWNLYTWSANTVTPVWRDEAEYGLPHWQFGQHTYAFADANRIVAIRSSDGRQTLVTMTLDDNGVATQTQALTLPYSTFNNLTIHNGLMCVQAGSAIESSRVIGLQLDNAGHHVVRTSNDLVVDPAYISQAKAISYPTSDGDTAHAFFYAPQNPDFIAPEGSLPPLVVFLHGGPTGATSAELDVRKQFWTSRGFALLDINYRGSTGFGRAYKEKLTGQWGVADVADCVFGVDHAVALGWVDKNKVAIRGGSAGGYTVLAALAFTDRFGAGASYYGIGDLETLAGDTHKFEARYMDGLVGPYPESKAVYQSRSPIHSIDRINCPVILFQGLDDKVVPPNQAEDMVTALKNKGVPVAYLTFAGEGHGFRQAKNLKKALESEWYFYGRVFDYDVSGYSEPFDF